MPADNSQTERIRRLKAKTVATSSSSKFPTDNTTRLSNKLGDMTYIRKTPTGVSVEETCCTDADAEGALPLLVLFGGNSDDGRSIRSIPNFLNFRDRIRNLVPGAVNTTWAWDGTTWSAVAPSTLPSARIDAAGARGNGKVMIFGGSGITTILNDTWVWDGSNWSNGPDSSLITPRIYSSMAYDGSNFVLYGGVDEFGNYLNETWVQNSSDTQWTQAITPTDVSGRIASTMASDGTTILRFGGTEPPNILFNDTWKWEGGSWTQQPQQDISGRALASMAYDGTQFVMFGGAFEITFEDIVLTNETRIWDSSNSIWSLVSTTLSPPARVNAAMAYDGTNVVLVGGQNITSSFSDTWLWNGKTQTWTEVTGTSLPGKYGMVLA